MVARFLCYLDPLSSPIYRPTNDQDRFFQLISDFSYCGKSTNICSLHTLKTVHEDGCATTCFVNVTKDKQLYSRKYKTAKCTTEVVQAITCYGLDSFVPPGMLWPGQLQ